MKKYNSALLKEKMIEDYLNNLSISIEVMCEECSENGSKLDRDSWIWDHVNEFKKNVINVVREEFSDDQMIGELYRNYDKYDFLMVDGYYDLLDEVKLN
ncbi:hypothetical protein PVK64_17935 [Aliivibrio sp. S4TY2]|uniref:hypothetical protein n=1 Tax=unclassified Aliivibrio TaxID=2645654 RepID=UPI002379F04D|nr:MULTISPECIES: hypothetical protein [unclassified Aliivibrio]MDD9158047.1 hypothetical protein [Aliivibrio sp. S4TY2]MDD9161910.1 hypothetical protein [Aliivibrio sp. S4TY1]MDD9166044.1 hypothetical protein [Aliivibrio sp. S4MY2]MDD9169990.1 hypothetical protein [Aliivibrio sp. S4MY4]MDD9187041.1 hypothetical protein [Aliivibrio sp. S4MY3]